MSWLLLAAVILVMLAGLIGALLPGVPGVPLIFLAIVFYAWQTGFSVIGWGWLAAFALLTLSAVLLDFLAAALGARRYGASKAGIIGALLGGAFGTVVLGPLGLAVGPFAGALAGEIFAGRPWREAARSGIGSALGLLFSLAGQLAIGGLMVGLFLVKVL